MNDTDPGTEVVVNLPGVSRPLYGLVTSSDQRADTVTVEAFHNGLSKVITVPQACIQPWHRTGGSNG